MSVSPEVQTKPPAVPRSLSERLGGRRLLLLGFALAVMADPVSSVAYAIEAALRALDGQLSLLLITMGAVVAVIALVVVNYQQIIARFPGGGGSPAATARAYGEAWSFIPVGALITDFVLTIAISVAAGSAAVVGLVPGLAPHRVLVALVLLLAVSGLTWFGHLGRLAFAAMTVAFLVAGGWVLVAGLLAPVPSAAAAAGTVVGTSSHAPSLAVLLAFPVAMALATGVEAPSSAIAQLAQLDDDGRRHFGRVTLWATLVVVGSLTLGLTALAVHLRVGVPTGADSTLVGELARAVKTPGVFEYFNLSGSLLLLAAAASSFQAGPGLLKALSRRDPQDLEPLTERSPVTGVLPHWLGCTNRHHTPYIGVVLYLAVSAVVVIVAGAREQELVLFYAVAVFISFLAGLASMARFSRREVRMAAYIGNLVGAVVVAAVLAVNLSRGYPLVSLAAALLIAFGLWRAWVRAGRPRADDPV